MWRLLFPKTDYAALLQDIRKRRKQEGWCANRWPWPHEAWQDFVQSAQPLPAKENPPD